MRDPKPLFSYPAPRATYYIYVGRVRVSSVEAPGDISLPDLLEGWLDAQRISGASRRQYHLDSR
jgi:hypothetical protein